MLASAGAFVDKAHRLGEVLLVAEQAPDGVAGNDLRGLVSDIRGRFGTQPAVVVLLGSADGKVPFVVAATKAAQDLGIKAGELVASFGPQIGGRGGGKADMAQGSGSDVSGIPAALEGVRGRVAELAGTPSGAPGSVGSRLPCTVGARSPRGRRPGRGRRIAVDVGSVRIGVASCDPDCILATPVETVSGPRRRGPTRRTSGGLSRLSRSTRPSRLSSVCRRPCAANVGKAAAIASAFARRLQRGIDPIPVRMADERLTTVTAARALRESGVRAKGQRPMIDQAAAVAILQGWLDERSRAVNVTDSDSSGRPTEGGL
ncbi:Holliday junction resolvase RuvX [Prescottella defluvii]|nr:Holliday junction resolvase RuvX [Prescottella defluvii]